MTVIASSLSRNVVKSKKSLVEKLVTALLATSCVKVPMGEVISEP